MGEIVTNASFQEQFAINPEVTLVTLGENLNWQIPPGTDIFLQSLDISERLVRLWFEWNNPENKSIRESRPDISNAATYALYVFFDYDKEKLDAWRNIYQRLFITLP